METVICYPKGYSRLTRLSIENRNNPVGKGSSNTTYATLSYNDSDATGYVEWPFDVSAIPENVTIDSVTCKIKIGIQNPDALQHLYARMCYNGSPRGSTYNFKNMAGVNNISSTGSWTRSELDLISLYLEIYPIDEASIEDAVFYFYGADLTVAYTYKNEKFMLKIDGSWVDASRVFKKVNGIWVEQTDLTNVIEDGVRYKNSGGYVVPTPTTIPVTITGTGDSQYCFTTIDGTKYSSTASGIEVMPGDTIQFTVWGGSDMTYVTINGRQVLTGTGTSATSYTWTVPDDISSIAITLYDDGENTAQIFVTATRLPNSTNLINFTVDGVTYQGEKDMTWVEWCNSSYNEIYTSSNLWYDDYNVMYGPNAAFLCNSSTGMDVRPTDTLINGGSYYLE